MKREAKTPVALKMVALKLSIARKTLKIKALRETGGCTKNLYAM